MADPSSMKDVVFDEAAAEDLKSKCTTAATRVEDLHASRTGWVTTAETDFEGYYSDVFSDNADSEATDASNLATCLRNVGDAVQYLLDQAKAENDQRKKARDWDARREEMSSLEKGWDDLWDIDQRPSSTLGQPDAQAPAAPVLQERSNPSEGSSAESGSTSSASPENLRSFATSSQGANDELDGLLSGLRAADQTFQDGCKWGTLTATSVWNGFQSYLDANDNDVTWADTLADAFEAAGGTGTVSTVADTALAAALQTAGVTVVRDTVTMEAAEVQGMPRTSGFADDPVNVATGGFVEVEDDLEFAGGSATLRWSRCYNATDAGVGALGPGWSSMCESGLTWGDDGEGRWRGPDGRLVVFPRLGQGWDRALDTSLWLTALPAGDVAPVAPDPAGSTELEASPPPAYEIADNAGTSWRLDAAGHPLSVTRGAGTRVDLTWVAGRLVGMSHERGRHLELVWNEDGTRLDGVEASDGRVVAYTYDPLGRLVAVHGGPRGERRYDWDDAAGLLCRVTDADGIVEVDNTYDVRGRVSTQRSVFGRVSRYAYLPGRVTVVSDEDGTRANTWVSDARGRLLGAVDADGKRQSTSWDRWGNLVMTRDRAGGVTVSQYDSRGRRSASVTPQGVRTDWEWDDSDRLTSLTVTVPEPPEETVGEGAGSAGAGTDSSWAAAAPAVTRFTYAGEDRNPSTITDPEGGVTRLVWDATLLQAVTDPEGVELTFAWDAHGDLVGVTNALGQRASLVRDAAGQVVEAVSPSGARTTYLYDPAGHVVERRDPDGAVWRWEYSAAGRRTAVIDPMGARTVVELGPDGGEAATVDPLGRRLETHRDDLGNIAGIRLPDGREWRYVHDALSRLTEVVSPEGGTWTRGYDARGSLTSTCDPTGVSRLVFPGSSGTAGWSDASATVQLAVDGLGRPAGGRVTATGPEPGHGAGRHLPGADEDDVVAGQVVVRDLCGRIVESLDAEGGLTLWERDQAGRVVRETSPGGRVTSYAYDACGRLAQVMTSGGGVTTITYDADSRPCVVDGPEGRTSVTRDGLGRVTSVTEPAWGTTRWSHDRCGRVRTVSSQAWGTSRYGYDAAGQVVSVTNALGGVTRYAYDVAGRIVSVTDPAGRVTTRTYNALDRVESVTDPLGRVTRAGYDAAGRQLWQVDADGGHLEWEHDAAGDVTRVSGGGAGGPSVLVSAVSRCGRALRVSDPEGSQELTFDRAGRLLRRTRDGAEVGRWTWDADGVCTGFAGATGDTVRYGHDPVDGAVRVTGTAFGEVMMHHDQAGNLRSMAGAGFSQSWERDAAGRVVAHDWVQGEAAGHSEVAYDAAGRVCRVQDADGTVAYRYDAAGQLVAVESGHAIETLTYDQAGFLTSRTVTDPSGSSRTVLAYDAAGQLESATGPQGETRYHYDAAGRRSWEEGPQGRRDFEWAPTGHLAGVRWSGASSEAHGGGQWRVERDALGLPRRVGGVDVEWDLATGPVPSVSGFGGVPVTVVPGAVAVGGEVTGSGWRPARPQAAGGGGSVWDVPPVVRTVGGVDLTGAGTLGLGGLELLGARAYDPATASFLSPDPVDHGAGAGPWAANVYSYAANSPLALSDPLGLEPLTDADLEAYTDAHTGWNLAGAWVSENKDYLIGGAMVVAGGVLMASGVGGPLGAAVLGAGVDTLVQRAMTGSVDYTEVAVTGVLGVVGGGAAAGAIRAGTQAERLGRVASLARTVQGSDLALNTVTGAGAGALTGGWSGGYNYMGQPGPHTVSGFLEHAGEGSLLGGATGGAGGAVGSLAKSALGHLRPTYEGIVYLREDATGTLKPYVGQTKSQDRYVVRQIEHSRAYPGCDFRFDRLESGVAPEMLDRYEEAWIRDLGGPTNKSHPNGGLSNARHQMSDACYQAAGGDPR